MSIRWPDRESYWHELDSSARRNRLPGLFVSSKMLSNKDAIDKLFRAALYTNNRFVNIHR